MMTAQMVIKFLQMSQNNAKIKIKQILITETTKKSTDI